MGQKLVNTNELAIKKLCSKLGIGVSKCPTFHVVIVNPFKKQE